MVEIITLSSKGQLVIPKGLREKLKLEQQDKFVIIAEHDSILLKRIRKEDADESMRVLLDSLAKQIAPPKGKKK